MRIDTLMKDIDAAIQDRDHGRLTNIMMAHWSVLRNVIADIKAPTDVPVARIGAYIAINSERDYQDAQRGNARRHPNQTTVLTPGEAILCMEKCLADAREAWYKPDGGTACLPFIRKVTALGVACMEHHGAPIRQ